MLSVDVVVVGVDVEMLLPGVWLIPSDATPSVAMPLLASACLADLVMLKFVTMWDIEAGLSVLVRVATEAVEPQEDKLEKDGTILDMFEHVRSCRILS